MGFTPQIETTMLEAPADVAPYDAGSEPLRVTVRTRLTPDDVAYARRIKPQAGQRTDFGEILAFHATFVIGWNVTGEVPPAEGGLEQFGKLPKAAMQWVLKAVAEVINTASAEVRQEYEARMAIENQISGETPAC